MMSSLTENKRVILALLALGFAIASSAISMPTAAFASSSNDGKNGDDDKNNCDDNGKDYKWSSYNGKDDNCDDNGDDDDENNNCDDNGKDYKSDNYDSNWSGDKWSDYKHISYGNDGKIGDDDKNNCDDNGHDHDNKNDDCGCNDDDEKGEY